MPQRKSYVLAFGEALHDEVRSRGVVVTTLCPGHTATGFDAAAGATASPLLRLLTMKARPVAASGIRALAKGKADRDRGTIKQDGRVFKPLDATTDAESHNEKNCWPLGHNKGGESPVGVKSSNGDDVRLPSCLH